MTGTFACGYLDQLKPVTVGLDEIENVPAELNFRVQIVSMEGPAARAISRSNCFHGTGLVHVALRGLAPISARATHGMHKATITVDGARPVIFGTIANDHNFQRR